MLTRAITAIVLLGLCQAAIGQQLTRQEVVVAGKQATALVVNGERVAGTAVCIDARGYFVTAYNTLRRIGRASLVLDAGLQSQRVLAAEAIVDDPNNGFVLLRTSDADGLHALELGSDEDLIETAEVLLFGFPVTRPTVKNQAFPNMGVSIGNVTSLRRERGHLVSILFDAEIHPAYLGGPVVDRTGCIVGLVEQFNSNTRVHSSAPVSRLRTFLTKVHIEFTPPELDVRKADQPAELSVRVDSLHPEGTLDVALELSSSPLDQRTIPLSAAEGNLYNASVVPFPKIEGNDPIEINAQFAAGRLSCRVNNQEVRVGDRALRLDEIARIQRKGEQFSVVLQDDETITATSLAGFPARADLGGYELPIDLLQAGELLLKRPNPPAALQFAVVVSRDGEEIARRKGEWRLLQSGGGTSTGGFTDVGGSIEFLPLSGDAPWPGFLEQIPGSVFDERGLRVPANTAIRSRMADLLKDNFQFDVELTFRPTGDDAACVGLGEAAVQDGGAARSVFLRLHPTYIHQGNTALIRQQENRGENIAESNLRTNGPHRITVTKRGDVVTFAADLDCDGPTPDDVLYTIPDIRTFAPFLDEKSTRLFFSRGASFSKVRFQQLPSDEPRPDADETASPFAPWPDFLEPAPNAIVGRSGGLVLGEGKFVASKIRGFATRDFTIEFEMVLSTEGHAIAVIGLGVWTPGARHPQAQSIYLRLHSLHHGEGKVGLNVPGRPEQPVVQFRRLGPHRVRIQRRGTTLTFHIDVDNDGPSPDDATRAVPNITAVMPYLHEKNTQLYFGSGNYRSIRLTEP